MLTFEGNTLYARANFAADPSRYSKWINTGDCLMNNIDSSRKIDDKIIYEPSMVIVGWLPVSLVVWALALLLLYVLMK